MTPLQIILPTIIFVALYWAAWELYKPKYSDMIWDALIELYEWVLLNVK